MAKLELIVKYEFTVWFYLLKLVKPKWLLKFIKGKTIAKCNIKGNNIKVSDIIVA